MSYIIIGVIFLATAGLGVMGACASGKPLDACWPLSAALWCTTAMVYERRLARTTKEPGR